VQAHVGDLGEPEGRGLVEMLQRSERAAVEQVGFDVGLVPGRPWQRALEAQIPQIASAAAFVGADGIGPWQHLELDAFLREFASRGCPVIPVILPQSTRPPELPIFLKGMHWVDFRSPEPDPLGQLIWGIRGTR
jgi:hypothetical protein